MAETLNFTVYAGDTKDIDVNVYDDTGAVKNLTGASINWTMGDLTKTVGNGITLTDPLGGEFTVRLNSSDTASKSGIYYYEADVTDTLGNKTTVLTGLVTIQGRL